MPTKRTLCLFFSMLGCTADPGSARQAILGGTEDGYDPAIVYVSSPDGFCTGTAIAPRVILTAAHCVYGISPPNRVFLGTNVETAATASIAVVNYLVHPDYDPGLIWVDNDIALLTTDVPGLSDWLPINHQPIDDSWVDWPVRLVGYGEDDDGGTGQKREATLLLDDYDDVNISFGNWFEGLAPGDSGGPALMSVGGVEVIVAVASFHRPVTGISYSQRVDTAADFIDAYVASVPEASPTAPGAAFGDFCLADAECDSHVCEPAGLWCTQGCSTDVDCPISLVCRNVLGQSVCTYGVNAPAPTPCSANGVAGTCLATSECTGAHHSVPGLCPGPADIQCCVSHLPPAPPPEEPPATSPPQPLPSEMPADTADPELTGGGCGVGGNPRGAMLPSLLLACFVLARLRRTRR